MTDAADCFAELGLERVTWIDPDSLKEAFHRRAEQCHPDRGGEREAFERVEAAHRILASPASRLRHLAALSGGTPAMRGVFLPEEQAGWIFELGLFLRRLELWMERWDSAGSAVARALLASEKMDLQDEAMRHQARAAAIRAGLETHARSLSLEDSQALAEAGQSFVYVDRAVSQLCDAWAAIASR